MAGSLDITALMKVAIEEAKKSTPEDEGVHPKVGAIIADPNGNILQRAHRGEESGSHAEYLCLKKAKAANQNLEGCVMFTTLEPCTARGPGKQACCTHIIKSKIKRVYIGMLDPNPAICGKGETRLRFYLDVERFPLDLVNEISMLNTDILNRFKEAHLSEESPYVSMQIHQIMRDILVRKGIPLVGDLPIDENLTTNDICMVCESTCASAGKKGIEVEKLVQEARAEAFDKKYADRTYEDDGRGLGSYWIDSVRSILHATDYQKRPMVVVGIGNGLEGVKLYADCKQLTAVDIGERSLQEAEKRLPGLKTFRTPAENLWEIPTGSQDIYISLRTYQSTYFDRNAALREAYRVVRQGGKVLISIANGFLEGGAVIQGLLKPGTSVVDPNLGFHIADQVRSRMSVLGFEEIGLQTSLDEIYVYGTRAR